jgi:proline iminopeptidase
VKSTPIVYLHGGPGGFITQEITDLIGPLAKEGFDIYLYDQIGSGQSTRLDDINEYTVNRHLKDLEAIIEKIGEEQVVLMGQSWGAMLGVSYLAEHCKQVAKAVFTGPGPILPINYSLAKQETPDSLNLLKPSISNADGNRKVYHNRAKLVQYVAHHFGIKMATDEEMDQFFTRLNSELKKSTVCDSSTVKPSIGGGGYYAHTMTVNSFDKAVDHRDKLAVCKTPILLLKGQCDNQPWGYGNEYLSLFENAELLIVSEAGHVFTENQSRQFITTVLTFLKEE